MVRLLNVVRRDESLLVLVFELCEGSDVLDHINARGGVCGNRRRGRCSRSSSRRSKRFTIRVCHRGVKPENAVVGKEGLKLIDFGLAKGLESANTRAIGTPDYMAPELLDKTDADGNQNGKMTRQRRRLVGGSFSVHNADWSISFSIERATEKRQGDVTKHFIREISKTSSIGVERSARFDGACSNPIRRREFDFARFPNIRG